MAKLNIDYAVLKERVGGLARKAGRMSARPVLLLYYVMVSRNTPLKDKMMIFSALSYILLPVNILNGKRLPVIGWIDEMMSVSVAYKKVCEHITPEMEIKVDELLDRWLPEYATYVEVAK